MSFDAFAQMIEAEFGSDAVIKHDREAGKFIAKFDEWRVFMGKSSKWVCYYNVRSKERKCKAI